MNRQDGTGGFTLVEVLIALAVTGFVAVTAHRLMSVTIDAARAVSAARLAEDRRENALRWLRAAFLSLEAGGAAGEFLGYRDHLSFSTWLEQPEGWATRERVALQVEGTQLAVRTERHARVVLADSVTRLAVDYLLEPGASTQWVHTWLSPLSTPVAVRLRMTRTIGGSEAVDTLLLLIKERG